MSDIVVHYPWLHPKLGQGPLPDGVVFFDPGVDMATELPRWRPTGLPCPPAEVRSIFLLFLN